MLSVRGAGGCSPEAWLVFLFAMNSLAAWHPLPVLLSERWKWRCVWWRGKRGHLSDRFFFLPLSFDSSQDRNFTPQWGMWASDHCLDHRARCSFLRKAGCVQDAFLPLQHTSVPEVTTCLAATDVLTGPHSPSQYHWLPCPGDFSRLTHKLEVRQMRKHLVWIGIVVI